MGDPIFEWDRRQPVTISEIAEAIQSGRQLAIAEDGELKIFSPEDDQKPTQRVTKTREGVWGSSASGGFQPPMAAIDQGSPERVTPWFIRKPARLALEKRAMADRFPTFVFLGPDQGGPAWSGFVKPNVEMMQYLVKICYTATFPYEAPRVFVLEPKLETSPHRYFDGSICLLADEKAIVFDDRGRLLRRETWSPFWTVAGLLPVVSKWLVAYEYHRRNCQADNGRPCIVNGCTHWVGRQHTRSGVVG